MSRRLVKLVSKKERNMKAVFDGTPIPFKKPFLCLTIKKRRNKDRMWIDVGGKIRLYISPSNEPTEKLLELCKLLMSRGYRVLTFGKYTGSFGPSHILRCGALFSRMSVFENGEGQEVKEVPAPTFQKYW